MICRLANEMCVSLEKKLKKEKKDITVKGFIFGGNVPETFPVQNVSVRTGNLSEPWYKYAVKVAGLEVIDMSKVSIPGMKKRKQLDLIFDNKNKKIYYFELKGNIDLDSEKQPATANKIDAIHGVLVDMFSDYTVVKGLLTWSSWSGNAEWDEVKIYYPKDFFNIINLPMDKETYHRIWENVGKISKKHFNYGQKK